MRFACVSPRARNKSRGKISSTDLLLPEPRFQFKFLGPKYWTHVALLKLIWLASMMPRRVAGAIGAQLGDLFRLANRKRRRIVEINLELCFPERNSSERQRMLVEHFRAYGKGIIDLGLIWWASEARLEQLFTVKGLENWLQIANSGQRTILVTPHTTGMDIGGVYLSRFYPIVSMMKRTRNPLVNWRLWKGRGRFGAQIIFRDQGIRQFIQHMRSGYAGYIMPDEDVSEARKRVFTSFFGVPTATVSVVDRLSRLTDAKVFPVFTRRLANGCYVVEICPSLTGFPTGNMLIDASTLNNAFEIGIRLSPEQYLWTLQWFKNRPDGKESPYS